MYQDGEGNVTLSTREGVGHVMPEYTERSGVELMEGSGVVDGRMIANVRCGDCAGSLDLAGTNNWISAWKSDDSLDSTDPAQQITVHDSMTGFEVDFTNATVSANANPFSNSTTVEPPPEDAGEESSSGGPNWDMILLAHGVIMTLVFTALYPIGALLMPLLGKWLIHASFQTLAFLLMWAGFALGYLYAEHDGYVSHDRPNQPAGGILTHSGNSFGEHTLSLVSLSYLCSVCSLSLVFSTIVTTSRTKDVESSATFISGMVELS